VILYLLEYTAEVYEILVRIFTVPRDDTVFTGQNVVEFIMGVSFFDLRLNDVRRGTDFDSMY
jgi:hypothetical protein